MTRVHSPEAGLIPTEGHDTAVVSGHTPCGCVDKVDALLAEQNSTLVTTFGFGGLPRRVIVQTEKRDPKKRGRGPSMLASFCPFCGERYIAQATGETGQ